MYGKKIKKYDAIFFKQPGNEQYIMATFVVGAYDLLDWAGVPRKKDENGKKISFQRALDEKRLDKIKTHFENCITPNSVLITISEENVINMEEIKKKLVNTEKAVVGELKIEVNDQIFDLNLKNSIEKVISLLKGRMPNCEGIINDNEINEDELSDCDEITNEIDCTNEEDTNLFDITTKSHLAETIKFLQDFLDRYDIDKDNFNEDEILSVRNFCEDYLKPAFLVDGQHRAFGAYNKITEEYEKGNENYEILLPICAIINSDWKESVFQFVIINQTAKRIDPKFLSSIISTSLTDDELNTFRNQLENSGAPVGEAVLINQINTSEYKLGGENINPFYLNIEFGIEKESENLIRYNTIKSLINRARNFKDGNTSVFGKTYQNFQQYLINNDIDLEKWNEKYWLDFLVYFWSLVERKFVSNAKLRYEIYKEEVDENEKVIYKTGTNLSFKVSMEYVQDSFINYLTKNSSLLQKLGALIKIDNNMISYDSIKNIFEFWCDDHKKDFSFFEVNWKGISSFKRNDDKFEGINSAFYMEKYRLSKLFKG